ncbi:MAG: hypothetical protein ABMA25_18060 [Ilumatobacteraceae bacterium]
MRTASRLLIALALSSAGVVGCSNDSPTGSSTAESSLTFRYVGLGDDGYIDQVVWITNPGRTAAVPRVEYTALDADGDVLPDVTVTTAFGSDRELLVVPSGETFDVLQFDGPGADSVEGVRSEVSASTSSDFVEPEAVIPVIALDATGTEISKFEPMTAVGLENPYTTVVHVRVVCIVYGPHPDDRPEPAIELTELVPRVSSPVARPPRSRSTRPLPGCSPIADPPATA